MITEALEQSVVDADVDPRDQAALALARRLASEIDAGGDLTKLSSPLLATLGALGLTLAARSGPQGRPQGASPAVDALAELRRRRAAR